MKAPEQDLENRAPIWDAFQMLFMDTDVTLSYPHIVETCSNSSYSVDELELILFNEILPAARFNMLLLPAPEWCGFDIEWLKDRVLKKHRFGRSRPWFFRTYTNTHWRKLRRMIIEKRDTARNNTL